MTEQDAKMKLMIMSAFVKNLSDSRTPKETLEERTKWDAQRSMSNYDDCFTDGCDSEAARIALQAREILKETGFE